MKGSNRGSNAQSRHLQPHAQTSINPSTSDAAGADERTGLPIRCLCYRPCDGSSKWPVKRLIRTGSHRDRATPYTLLHALPEHGDPIRRDHRRAQPLARAVSQSQSLLKKSRRRAAVRERVRLRARGADHTHSSTTPISLRRRARGKIARGAGAAKAPRRFVFQTSRPPYFFAGRNFSRITCAGALLVRNNSRQLATSGYRGDTDGEA